MRNKVKRNNARRLTAVLLMLLMIMGSFSVASFAQEVPGEEAVKTTEAAPAESAPTGEAQKPAAEVTQPAAPVQPSTESSQPENNGTPETVTPQEGSSNVTEETQPAAEEAQPEAEDAQAAEIALEEVTQPAAGDESGKEVKSTAPVQLQAASAEAKNEDAASGSGDAGTHKISINSSEMPRTISLAFYIKSGNVITEYVYDGTTIYDNTNGKDVTDIGLIVAAGSVLTIQRVIGLEREPDFQEGDSPSSRSTTQFTKQIKLLLKDKDGKELQRISLNNSTTMTSISAGLDNVASAAIGIAGRIRVTMGTDMYHKGSCIVMNTTDSGPKQSEFGDIFALEGDKISIDYGADYYDHVDIGITDAGGKNVAFSNGSFTMPASMANVNMIYYYKARNVKVINTRPERGTISVKKDQYSPGDKVVVKISSKSGYRFNTKTLAYIYTKDGKMTVQKITKDKDGKYSFIMPFYDIDIRGVFVAKETAAESSDPTAFIDYADGEDEEEAVEELPEEEELQQMLDVTPLVSRVVAETVMTATVSVAAMTH